MRCAKHALPGIEWEKVEEAHGQRLFELPMENEELDFGVTEANIANVDPRVEFEEDPEAANEDAGNAAVEDDQNDVIILDKASVTGVAESGEAHAFDAA